MTSSSSMDRLAEVQQVTLIFRLVVNKGGYLLYGKMINTNDDSHHQFRNWDEITAVLRKMIPEQPANNAPTDPDFFEPG